MSWSVVLRVKSLNRVFIYLLNPDSVIRYIFVHASCHSLYIHVVGNQIFFRKKINYIILVCVKNAVCFYND